MSNRSSGPDDRGASYGVRGRLLSVAALAVILASGCAPALRPIFDEPKVALAWPAAPAKARVRYVGQLSTSADLKPPPTPFSFLAKLLVGEEEPLPLFGPRAIICTNDGERLWVADPGGRCLHLFDLKNRSYRRITRADDAWLLSPVGVSLGPGESIFVSDSQGAAIYRLSDRTGELIESLRLPDEILRPVATAYDSSLGELYVVDVSAHNVKVLGPDWKLRRIIGRRGEHPGEFNFPSAIARDGERIWIADTGNNRVQCLTREGDPVASIGKAGDAPGDLAMPKGLALDSDGHLYVVDARFENVQVFDRSGRLLLFFGEEGTGPGEFWLPAGVFVDRDNRIWICDSYNRRVQVFDYVPLPVAGAEGPGG